jgi:methylenetetrahydrofolate--tRNA-(uracil-5-)-methyltransferase
MKPESAAGMLKSELSALGSKLFAIALEHRVAAGGALAIDRQAFAADVTSKLDRHPYIRLIREERKLIPDGSDAVIIASGPLIADDLAAELVRLTGKRGLSFFDAAAPIVMGDSLDHSRLFSQSRYEGTEGGDYLNAAFSREEYEAFVKELCSAERVVAKDFESKELFQACQPIEEIARKGFDAPRFGPLKPVGITDPRTGRRPWAVVQLRAENAAATAYNLVGFQTNLAFPEQRRVFRMIPGLEQAEFARYGVMHRNTFIDAPHVLLPGLRLREDTSERRLPPIYVAGQLAGTEGYCEAIMSGLFAALNIYARSKGEVLAPLPAQTAFGALMAYATDPATQDYQPMHVSFGIMPPLAPPVKQKEQRYRAYSRRGAAALDCYCQKLRASGVLPAACPPAPATQDSLHG